jgi:hypothetical protein
VEDDDKIEPMWGRADMEAACKFLEGIMSANDAVVKGGKKLWRSWAIHDAFVAGVHHARKGIVK